MVNITGSWCPNCHDEAPFLAEVYNKYHDRGLEIVALSFEEPEQLRSPTRLRAFIQEYGIKYTVLLAGETSSAKDKLTNALDGIHGQPPSSWAGIGWSRASMRAFPARQAVTYKEAKKSFIANVNRLLAENEISSR